ncbi:MAG: hypothetical protein ACLFV8_12735 [Alphaproteobacteria bacterium]
MVLRSGLLHQDRPIVEAIRQAAHILAAPHYIRDVAVTGAKNHSNNNSFGKNENDALPLRFTVQETLFDQPVRIEVELFDEERKIIRDLMKIYISNELRRIHSEISAELTAEAGAEDMAEGSAQTRAAVEERASRILKENEHNGNLENRKYALCLLSLAILKQRTAPIVEIFGNMRKSYREELSSEYGIGRRTNSSSKSNSSQDGPHLSQIFEEKKALEYVERQFPGLEIFKSYGRIEARFRNG